MKRDFRSCTETTLAELTLWCFRDLLWIFLHPFNAPSGRTSFIEFP